MELFLYFIGLLFAICFVGLMNDLNKGHILKLMETDRKTNKLNHEILLSKLEQFTKEGE